MSYVYLNTPTFNATFRVCIDVVLLYMTPYMKLLCMYIHITVCVCVCVCVCACVRACVRACVCVYCMQNNSSLMSQQQMHCCTSQPYIPILYNVSANGTSRMSEEGGGAKMLKHVRVVGLPCSDTQYVIKKYFKSQRGHKPMPLLK